ncbi:hypothetical protein WJX74_002561 [Apatococcus lobatus]|uniref:Protein kinase domain-containing protein n=1 Tax=Apatococcus lobatus TaxID=904363 RepID=A0AAW1RGP5_9CHLO
MYEDDIGAAEAESEIQNALMMAADATESCSLEDRYSALAMAEETAAEYGLMYVLPKYYELAAYRKLKAASCSNGPKFSVVHEADVSLHHLLHSPAWPLAPSIRAGQFKGMPCALKLVNLQRQPLSAAQLWHEIYMLRNPLQDLQGQAVPKLVGFGIIKGKGLAFMSTELLGPALSELPEPEAARHAPEAEAALAALHSNRVQHGDVHLGNFLLRHSGMEAPGNRDAVSLIDFSHSACSLQRQAVASNAVWKEA